MHRARGFSIGEKGSPPGRAARAKAGTVQAAPVASRSADRVVKRNAHRWQACRGLPRYSLHVAGHALSSRRRQMMLRHVALSPSASPPNSLATAMLTRQSCVHR
jgi:hypothetical protein